jgi:hypothetical protein
MYKKSCQNGNSRGNYSVEKVGNCHENKKKYTYMNTLIHISFSRLRLRNDQRLWWMKPMIIPRPECAIMGFVCAFYKNKNILWRLKTFEMAKSETSWMWVFLLKDQRHVFCIFQCNVEHPVELLREWLLSFCSRKFFWMDLVTSLKYIWIGSIYQ